MENTSQPSPPQKPNGALLAIEARLSEIERRMAEGFTGDEATAAEERPLRRAELSEELEHHRDQLRDCEKALVERIAEVDDDRRATASRLQRAWQTQREEIDDRLRRHAGLLSGLLMLFAVLFSVALLLVYRQTTIGQLGLAAEVAEIRQELASSTGEERAAAGQVREKLDDLAAEVGTIAKALDQLDREGEQGVQESLAAERAAREEVEARLSAEIRRFDEERGQLAQSLESLRSELKSLAANVVQQSSSPETQIAEEAALDEVVEGVPEEAEEGPPMAEVSEIGAVEAEGGAAPPMEKSETGTSGRSDALIAGRGDLYALQLIGFFSRESLEEFVSREGLPAQVYWVRQTYRGRPWYALIHSLYDDYSAADEALSRLPADLAALKPWIRPLSKVTELQIINTRQESE